MTHQQNETLQAGALQAVGRTPQDYAIEHAEYMATTAEGLIEAVSDLSKAEQERDEGLENPSDVDAAQETVREGLSTLRNRIYEFRKRKDRALAATQPNAAPGSGVVAGESLRQSVKEAIMSYRVKAGHAMSIDDFADAIAPLFYLAREPDALAVDCPRCQQKAGEPCIWPEPPTRNRDAPHDARKAAAATAREQHHE